MEHVSGLFQLSVSEVPNMTYVLFAGVERLQVLVGSGGVRRRYGTVRAVRAHLAAGHYTLQQVSSLLPFEELSSFNRDDPNSLCDMQRRRRLHNPDDDEGHHPPRRARQVVAARHLLVVVRDGHRVLPLRPAGVPPQVRQLVARRLPGTQKDPLLLLWQPTKKMSS